MILQESLCSELWCGGSQEPRPPAPGGPAPPPSPAGLCVHGLGRSDDAQLEKAAPGGEGKMAEE